MVGPGSAATLLAQAPTPRHSRYHNERFAFVLDKTVRLRIRTRERRYIVGADDPTLERLLRAQGPPIEYVPGRPETEITTIYFDTPEGTWSRGLTPTKIRARSYQDPDHWWLELKRRQNERVDKWRRPMEAADVVANLAGTRRWKRLARTVGESPLVPLFAVSCYRTAFEWLSLRVTLDRGLTFYAVDPERPLQPTRRLGWVDGLVVEVKCEGEVPDWLQPGLEGHLASNYSKSRYALALLAGEQRPRLVADSPVGAVAHHLDVAR
jgi:hypothetical protein